MSTNTLTCDGCGAYDKDFIEDLKESIYNKIGLETSKDLNNLKYDLDLCVDLDYTENLVQYLDILDRLLECDSCLKDEDVPSIISTIKNKLK